MKLERLELTNFRSYEGAAFELHPNVTLVVGPNASGKTNLLEALYVLASTKSFRAKDRDLVRHGQEFFRVVARTDGGGEESGDGAAVGGGTAEFAVGLIVAGVPLTKKISHDGVARTMAAHVGQLLVTLFEPSDLELVSGSPEGRRRYLDFVLCQTDAGYMRTMQLYRRVLKQRNALLDGLEMNRVRDQIFAWDVQLAELALAIYERRQRLLGVLNEMVPGLYGQIAGGAEAVRLDYVPSVEGDYAGGFLEALGRNFGRDMAAGFTTIGPHREDFKVRFKNNDITAVASRGEVRTVVLAMKLAELEYAQGATGVRPMLLLDDVFSELDRDRRSFLLGRLADHQSIITTTDADALTRELTMPRTVIETGGAMEGLGL